MSGWIQIVGLVVIPSVALIGLFYYVRATIEQAEAMQKPCVVLHSMLRDAREAVLNMGGIRGDLILGAVEGQVALENIGTGPAVNIAYVFEKVQDAKNLPVRSEGSIPTLSPKQRLAAHVSRGIFSAHSFDCTITYESLSKRRYETRLSVNDVVLGEFKFSRLGLWARLTRSARERKRLRKAPKPIV